jgi:hypothetical protein
MTDAEFLTAFAECTLPAAAWTHEAHVRMGWLMLARLPYHHAVVEIRKGIQRFNAAVLKKDMGYHETITVVFTRLIAVARKEMPLSHDFTAFKATYPKLMDSKLSALLVHYDRDTLFSPAARASYIAPDLVPLPELEQ